jgi:hypothetical protein
LKLLFKDNLHPSNEAGHHCTDCLAECFDFSPGKSIVVTPVDESLTSDAGLPPIRQLDERLGFTARFAAALHDGRSQRQIAHAMGLGGHVWLAEKSGKLQVPPSASLCSTALSLEDSNRPLHHLGAVCLGAPLSGRRGVGLQSMSFNDSRRLHARRYPGNSTAFLSRQTSACTSASSILAEPISE